MKRKCALCGARLRDEKSALAHLLVAHGAPAKPKRRSKAWLGNLHRHLEEMGFGETEAHIIVQAVSEEMRK